MWEGLERQRERLLQGFCCIAALTPMTKQFAAEGSASAATQAGNEIRYHSSHSFTSAAKVWVQRRSVAEAHKN